MQLCLECGRVEEHGEECPRRPPKPKTSEDKQKRTEKAMAVAKGVLGATDETAKTSAKLAIVKLSAAEALLERYPSRDLQGFDKKRAHNELATSLAKKRGELEESSGLGRRFTEDARFAKLAIEALFAQALRREEARRFDVTALSKLPVQPIGSLDRPLKKIAEEIDTRLGESRGLDEKVRAWGWKNMGRLMLGLDPLEVPDDLLEGEGVLGKLGVGKAARREEVLRDFKPLGAAFRERLYLIGANSIILPAVSRLAVAEEAWRKLLAKDDGSERWDRIWKEEKELLEYLVGPEPFLPGGIEGIVAMLAANSRALRVLGLRPVADVRGVEWEAWAKGYFLEIESIAEGDNRTAEFATRRLANLLVQRAPGEVVDRARVAAVLQNIHDAWRARPPGGNPGA